IASSTGGATTIQGDERPQLAGWTSLPCRRPGRDQVHCSSEGVRRRKGISMWQRCRYAGALEAWRPASGVGCSPGVRALALAVAMWSALALAPTSAAPGEPLAESGILAAHQSSSLPTATGDAPDAVIVVGIQHGWLTVDLRRAPLAEVLWMIGDRAGLRVLLHGELGGPITAAFTALALDQGLRRLIRGHSFPLTYPPSRDAPPH